MYSVFNNSKNPVIERFNRTLTNKLWKQFTVQGNQKWLKILPGIQLTSTKLDLPNSDF